MKRLLYIIGAAILGAGLYVGDAPGISAQELGPSQEVTLASAEPQSTVARLAEASLAMRRTEARAVAEANPEPRPEKLFGKK